MSLRIAVLAGELSGDRLGASLIAALRRRHPDLEVIGVGGPAMVAAGLRPIAEFSRLGINGFVQPVLALPDLVRLLLQLRREILAFRPDAFIGVDFNVFNLLLERVLKARGVRTVHYVSPSVYAWRRGRLKRMHRSVDLMLTLYPFEPPLYAGLPLHARFVGHPMADEIALEIDRPAARRALELPETAPVLAVFPGSRSGELDALGSDFLVAARLLAERLPGLTVAIAVARSDFVDRVAVLAAELAPDLPIRVFLDRGRDVLAACDLVLAKSGTCTLEAALSGRPMVVAYRVGYLSYRIATALRHGDFLALPNILANAPLVPEFLQGEVNPERLAEALFDELRRFESDPTLAATFAEQHRSLRRDAAERAAEAVLELVEGRLSTPPGGAS